MPKLIVLTGASGSGKTTLANALASQYGSQLDALSFDSIGIPPVEEMIPEFGSGEAWQRAKTMEWMKRIAGIKGGSSVLFEGQMRLGFIHEALTFANSPSSRIVLFDLGDEPR